MEEHHSAVGLLLQHRLSGDALQDRLHGVGDGRVQVGRMGNRCAGHGVGRLDADHPVVHRVFVGTGALHRHGGRRVAPEGRLRERLDDRCVLDAGRHLLGIDPKVAARRALELEPNLAEAHTSLAYLKHPPESTRLLERAVELKPSYALAHQWLAFDLLVLGHLSEARKHAILSAELAPALAPLRALWYS